MSQRTFFNGLLVLAIIAAVSGGLALLLRPDSNLGIEIILPTATPTPELKVYISGAVRAPGVYTLQRGDRLEDVVKAAGGLLPDAEASAVNMAERVKDEEHFHIPKVGEAPLVASRTEKESEDDRIDINTAPVPLLMTLDGIAEILEQRIGEYRETHGPFSAPAEIMKVGGIGQVTYEGIRDSIRVSLEPP